MYKLMYDTSSMKEYRARKSMDIIARFYSLILTTIFVLGLFIALGGRGFENLIGRKNFDISVTFTLVYFAVDFVYYIVTCILIQHVFAFNMVDQFVHHLQSMKREHLILFFVLYVSVNMAISIVFCCFL